MHFRQGKSVREIVRLTSLSRNTVRKWLKTHLDGEPRYRRSARPSKLSAFHEALKQALKATTAATAGSPKYRGPKVRPGQAVT
jgi:transposase